MSQCSLLFSLVHRSHLESKQGRDNASPVPVHIEVIVTSSQTNSKRRQILTSCSSLPNPGVPSLGTTPGEKAVDTLEGQRGHKIPALIQAGPHQAGRSRLSAPLTKLRSGVSEGWDPESRWVLGQEARVFRAGSQATSSIQLIDLIEHPRASAETYPSRGPSVLFPLGTCIENLSIYACLVITLSNTCPFAGQSRVSACTLPPS